MLDTSREARITDASERFMAGELSAGELLDRAASALWDKGEDGTTMATQYNALPGGDGGEWAGALADAPPAPRHLAPVGQGAPILMAQNGAGQPIGMAVRTVEVRLTGHYEGFSATMRINPRRSVLDGLKSGDTDQAIAAAFALIVRWKFFDEDAQPIPLSAEAVYDLPDDLLAALLRGYFETFVEAVTPDKSDAAGD